MIKFLVGGIALGSIGLVFIIEPAQFFMRNEVMVKLVNSKDAYRKIFKFIGYLLVLIGMLLIIKEFI
jgi:hypothetical protein